MILKNHKILGIGSLILSFVFSFSTLHSQESPGHDIKQFRNLTEAIKGSEELLVKYRESDFTPNVMFQLVELYAKRSILKFQREMLVFEEAENNFDKGLLKQEPSLPRIDYSAAIKLADELLQIFPNAGFRDNKPYTEKGEDTFRVICLGDSFVEGTGGNVADRFCNQIEATINRHMLLGAEIKAEAYALGVGSWTAANAATYMISHISAYDPDLIIAMMVSNDIADGQGVNGIGRSSNTFSPENRTLGSGLFSAAVSINFGEGGNYFKYELGPESVKRWDKAFSLYKRLEDLQQDRGKKMIFSVLDTITYFSELARKYHAKFEMKSPFLTTNYFPAENTGLLHNSHPNRYGHQIIANHYLHTMVQQGWISDPDSRLDVLHEGLSLETTSKVQKYHYKLFSNEK